MREAIGVSIASPDSWVDFLGHLFTILSPFLLPATPDWTPRTECRQPMLSMDNTYAKISDVIMCLNCVHVTGESMLPVPTMP